MSDEIEGQLYKKIKELPKEDLRAFEPDDPSSVLNSLCETHVFDVTNILNEAKAEWPTKPQPDIPLTRLQQHWFDKWFGKP